jgi:hypothetical protein
MADDPHVTAALGLLTAGIPQPAYDGKVPDPVPEPPWLLLYATVRYVRHDRLPRRSQRAVVRLYCHCVGGSASAARKVAVAARGVLLDVKPTVEGRNCDRIEQEDSQPPRPDEALGPMFMDQVDVYRFDSEPA